MVPLNRALSKLGILSRAQATEAIRDGRVRVDGRVIRDPLALVVPERARIAVDDVPRSRAGWRTLLFHKPRGVVTTRRDPEGRRTIYDVIGEPAQGLVAVGRLDLATSGLLLLTTDTRLADWVTDPANGVPRVYVVTVRGRMTEEKAAKLAGDPKPPSRFTLRRSRRSSLGSTASGGGRVAPPITVLLRKASSRESHVTLELREGKNREVRRLFESAGHEVTRLKRVRFGGLELGDLQPGEWRDLTRAEIAAAF
jgi:23S rRNA pseudouridine2605 synthase